MKTFISYKYYVGWFFRKEYYGWMVTYMPEVSVDTLREQEQNIALQLSRLHNNKYVKAVILNVNDLH